MKFLARLLLLVVPVLAAGVSSATATATGAPASPATAVAPAAPLAPIVTRALAAEFRRIDTNEDGRVSSSEHEVYARALFDELDGDVDYKLTVAEIQAAPGKFFRHVSAGAGGFLGGTELSPAEKFQRIDVNHDGVVSRDEHADAARAKFRELDGNSNGELSPEEFAAGG
jgi:hypothetical protein